MNKRESSSGRIVKQALQDKLIGHKHYIREYGEDLPEIRNWKWRTQDEQRNSRRY
jgi:xylulose-5-phosphate/fructose-6-phosphate phosphoketolase